MMKKIMFAGLLALVLASCKNDVPSAPMEPAPAPVTPSPAVPETPNHEVSKEQDGTAVQIGSDGVSVESKKGENHTDVSIKDGKAAVDVKTK